MNIKNKQIKPALGKLMSGSLLISLGGGFAVSIINGYESIKNIYEYYEGYMNGASSFELQNTLHSLNNHSINLMLGTLIVIGSHTAYKLMQKRFKDHTKVNVTQEYPTGSCVIIKNSDGKFLATSRRNAPDLWGLPGGKIDPEELPINAAVRELKEETDININKKDLNLVYEGLCGPGKDGRTFYVYTYEFTGDCDNVPFKAIEPGIDVQWVTKEQLNNGPFGSYNQQAIQAYENKDFKNKLTITHPSLI